MHVSYTTLLFPAYSAPGNGRGDREGVWDHDCGSRCGFRLPSCVLGALACAWPAPRGGDAMTLRLYDELDALGGRLDTLAERIDTAVRPSDGARQRARRRDRMRRSSSARCCGARLPRRGRSRAWTAGRRVDVMTESGVVVPEARGVAPPEALRPVGGPPDGTSVPLDGGLVRRTIARIPRRSARRSSCRSRLERELGTLTVYSRLEHAFDEEATEILGSGRPAAAAGRRRMRCATVEVQELAASPTRSPAC